MSNPIFQNDAQEFETVKQFAETKGFFLFAKGQPLISSQGKQLQANNLFLVEQSTGNEIVSNGNMQDIRLKLGYGVMRDSLGNTLILNQQGQYEPVKPSVQGRIERQQL